MCALSHSTTSAMMRNFIYRRMFRNRVGQKSRSYSESSKQMDALEIPTFISNSNFWWDRNGGFKVLHDMNPLRIELLHKCLPIPSPKPWFPLYGINIMDIGCGGGILSEPLSRLGAKVVGIDTLSEGIAAAKAHLEVNAAEWKNAPFGAPEYLNINADAAATKFSGAFDAVIASEVLEHVSDWKNLVRSAAACLKPGGHFIATTVNRTMLSYWLGIVVAEDIIKITPKGMHSWDKFINPSELSIAAIRCNLEPRSVLGMTYCPLSRTWSWTDSQAINYAFHAVKS